VESGDASDCRGEVTVGVRLVRVDATAWGRREPDERPRTERRTDHVGLRHWSVSSMTVRRRGANPASQAPGPACQGESTAAGLRPAVGLVALGGVWDHR